MRFAELARKLIMRGEVDDLDRRTQQMTGLRDDTAGVEASIASLRASVADDRHPDLSAAIARRNATRI